ncbi:MAG: hypothetical protein ACYCYR_15220 [Desulfobulbaceae bacterium]
MLFHPGILSLLTGSGLAAVMTLYASLLGVIVLRRWDFESSSAYQLALERKTSLVSTLMSYVLGFQILSLILFVYTAEDIHRLFVGAMCATGSLNANPVGWLVLFSKIAACFAAGLWLALNHLDQQAEDYPLLRLKYGALLGLLPLVLLDIYLQLRYFLGLDPDIITSCCGSLFSSAGDGVASGLAGLPAGPAMLLFYGGVALYAIILFLCLSSDAAWPRYLLTVSAAGLFVLSLASIVSFISMYIYELPTHHCPFDIIQREYHYQGYLLYGALFTGVFFGLLPGLFHPVRRISTLRERIGKIERSWLLLSLGGVTLFAALAGYAVLASNLIYFS